MRHAFAAVFALALAPLFACQTPAILTPEPSSKCGHHAVICGAGRCCFEHEVCGFDGPFSTCRAGLCCYTGDDSSLIAAHRPHPQIEFASAP